jgi:hypothetical protein
VNFWHPSTKTRTISDYYDILSALPSHADPMDGGGFCDIKTKKTPRRFKFNILLPTTGNATKSKSSVSSMNLRPSRHAGIL